MSRTHECGRGTVLTSSLGPVNGGTVMFTIAGAGQLVIGVVNGGAANTAFTIPANTPAGTYPIQAYYSGVGQFSAATDSSKTFAIGKATFVIAWANPADISPERRSAPRS
ncbi:MAG: Ig-like domain-containing protein [Bryobacteraceae bacterium]